MTLMDVYINLTRHDIDIGCRRSCYTCPIAWAFSRINPNVKITPNVVCLLPLNKSGYPPCEIKLPQCARDFINGFDWSSVGNTMQPQQFKVQIPVEYVMLPIINNMIGV